MIKKILMMVGISFLSLSANEQNNLDEAEVLKQIEMFEKERAVESFGSKRVRLENEINIVFDMLDQEFTSLLPKKLAGKLDRDTYYEERAGRIVENIQSINKRSFNKKIKMVELVLSDGEAILKEEERMAFFDKRFLIPYNTMVDRKIFMGRVYLFMGLVYAEGYFEDKDPEKAANYFAKTEDYLSATGIVVNLLKSNDLMSSVLAENLDNELPFAVIENNFKRMFEKFEKTKLPTELSRIEYVYALNDYVIYLETTGNKKKVKNYSTIVDKLNSAYKSLKPVSRFGIYTDNF